MSIKGDTDVGRAPEVGAIDEKVGEDGGHRWAGRGKTGQA